MEFLANGGNKFFKYIIVLKNERGSMMNVSVLGGGNEVGASCLHIKIADTNILIDAGMRMHGDHPLPALGMLDELVRPDVILVTNGDAANIVALVVVLYLF